jgi:hypothetical protein
MELLPLEMVKLELLKDISHYKLMLSAELLNKKFKLNLVIQTIFLKNKLLENHEFITEIDLEEKIIKKEEKEDKIVENKVKEDPEEKVIMKEEDKIVENKEKENLEDKMVKEDHLDNTKISQKEKVKMIDQKCNGLKSVLLSPDKKDLTF